MDLGEKLFTPLSHGDIIDFLSLIDRMFSRTLPLRTLASCSRVIKGSHLLAMMRARAFLPSAISTTSSNLFTV